MSGREERRIDIEVVPYLPAGLVSRERDAELDLIFFASSATRSFADDGERAAFRERWLGRYLDDFARHAFLAVDRAGGIVGYVVGALSDPAGDARFQDIGYWHRFADLTDRYPAHLHINVAPGARDSGIGGRLIEAFAAHARVHGCRGVHVVTGARSRNLSFYTRHGFAHGREIVWNGVPIVLLHRDLAI